MLTNGQTNRTENITSSVGVIGHFYKLGNLHYGITIDIIVAALVLGVGVGVFCLLPRQVHDAPEATRNQGLKS